MGLGRDFLDDLIELKTTGALDSAKRVVEIGAQQLDDYLILSPRLAELWQLFGTKEPPHFMPVGLECFTERAPLAAPVWYALGFEHQSIDIKGGTIRLDLNHGRVPWSLRGSYDLLVNGGTTEHIANQGNAFRAMHDLMRVGGVMYHEVPSIGWLDHGLISYQPKFFHRLARENDYEMIFFKVAPERAWREPEYFRQYNEPYGLPIPKAGPSIELRIAFRKRFNSAFVMPVDG